MAEDIDWIILVRREEEDQFMNGAEKHRRGDTQKKKWKNSFLKEELRNILTEEL